MNVTPCPVLATSIRKLCSALYNLLNNILKSTSTQPPLVRLSE
jgi:hypothetical protein